MTLDKVLQTESPVGKSLPVESLCLKISRNVKRQKKHFKCTRKLNKRGSWEETADLFYFTLLDLSLFPLI